MVKKITFSIFSLALIYLSVKLVMVLLSPIPANYNYTAVFINSFLVNLYITGVFAFPGFVFATSRLIGTRYYKLHNPKILTKVYSFLGVDLFRRILLVVYWGRKRNRKKYFTGTRAGIKKFLYESKQSEFGHLGAFVFITIVSIAVLLERYILLSLVIMLINIIGNYYPILLQRYHRIRIEKITVNTN
jgi:hypothetical protein